MGKIYSKCWKPPSEGVTAEAKDIYPSNCDRFHLDVVMWLKTLDLKSYGHLFKYFNGVEDMLSLSEWELKTLGVKNGSHRARMMASLIILRDKYDRAEKRVSCLSAYSSVCNSLAGSCNALDKNCRLSLPVAGAVSLSIEPQLLRGMEPLTGSEASPEDLKRVLEWELSLDNNDLRSHAWYHGTIPRQRAEELMSEEGEFLIRDCISRPGDYVLTCRWKGTSLHFVINKVVFQPFTVYEKIQYQFEDDCFDTVPDLVTFYVGNKRPISVASGAVVSKPVNRSMPLSYYATRYGLECQMHYATIALEKAAHDVSAATKAWSPAKGETPTRRMSQPSDESQKQSDDTHPSGVSTMPRPSSTADYPHRTASTFSTLHAQQGTKGQCQSPRSNPTISTTAEEQPAHPRRSAGEGSAPPANNEDSPPPKPSRVPSKRYGTTASLEVAAQRKASTGNENVGVSHLYSELNYPEKSSKQITSKSITSSISASEDVAASSGKDPSGESEKLTTPKKPIIPELNPPSDFDLENFDTLLLPTENKPLDPPALARMRCMLLEFGPRVIASHLTRTDLDILRVAGQRDLGLGVVTGFELIVLPQGQQLRLDLLERTECLKFFVAITILTCGDEDVRSQVLNKWIQVAIETKTALGNLYGFTGIMQGLALPQISRLRSTWLKLRQTCTENAFTYETKLRPTLKSMQECSNPQAPNTCIPYLLAIILILQRHAEVTLGTEDSPYIDMDVSPNPVESTSFLNKEAKGAKVLKLGLPWESTAADYGLQLLLTHLEIGRSVNHQWQTYRRNSEIVLENAKYDDFMLDMFRTEFHLRFLWGLKGSHVSAKERYSKFLQVLNVMSERCEPV